MIAIKEKRREIIEEVNARGKREERREDRGEKRKERREKR